MLTSLLAFAAAWCWMRRPARLPLSRAGAGATEPATLPLAERPWVRMLACVAGAAMIGFLLAGPVALVAGTIVGAAIAWWVATLEPSSVTREREAIARDLPMAADLMAACALVGAPIERAIAVVADSLGGPITDRLRAVVARLELGADPASEWRRLEDDLVLATLARTLLRTTESGAPAAEGLTRLATDRRRERRAVLLGRARAVGVKSAGPLAACFLPAFMLIGVVPIVVGVFAQLSL